MKLCSICEHGDVCHYRFHFEAVAQEAVADMDIEEAPFENYLDAYAEHCLHYKEGA